MLKRWLAALLALFAAASPAAADSWREGGLYATSRQEGGYVLLKILKLDADGVHVRVYSNVYSVPPKAVDTSTLYLAGDNRHDDEPLGMGHLPISRASFAGWDLHFVQQSSVTEEELEGYRIWQEAQGGYF
ncbi:hypothetical protein [uncultured Xanthomonas sp.]|uniref:hypothetical protein n=1 Tax=uncultured Xanthomonas sp. TaxID=152831 RepID=UPI0025D43847|nr:hypothetical protein [uncultured Xanthomonas sp.]